MKYHLVQLGCQMNRSDAQRLASVLEAMGYRLCPREEEADLLGVVACSVRQKAIDKVYSKISKWNNWKTSRPLLTFLSGCVLEEDRLKLLDRFDLVFSIDEVPRLPRMIREYGVVGPASLQAELPVQEGPVWIRYPDYGSRSTPIPGLSRQGQGMSSHQVAVQALRDSTLTAIRQLQGAVERSHPQVAGLVNHDTKAAVGGFWQIAPSYDSSFQAFVPIQNGCDKFCSYCAVPYTRGREVSRPSGEILSEIETLLDRGYRCITLLGQNVNSYGLDRQGTEMEFYLLLDQVGQLADQATQRPWIYYTSPHPRDMNTRVLEVMAAHPSLARQIHLPMQSGDDQVLKRMNRAHDLERYRGLVRQIRSILPESTLFTDIITGFSGETQAEHQATCRAMEEFGFQMAYIAMYSPRPGAASHHWPDDLALEEKKQRLHELTGLLHQSSLAWNQNLVGRTLDVLVDSSPQDCDWVGGFTEGRIQVRVRCPAPRNKPGCGSLVQARITEVRPLAMEGILS